MQLKDPYQILGVSPTADEKQLKTAYRRLAKKYHPDLHPGDKVMLEKFREVNEAYDALNAELQKARKVEENFGINLKSFRSGKKKKVEQPDEDAHREERDQAQRGRCVR